MRYEFPRSTSSRLRVVSFIAGAAMAAAVVVPGVLEVRSVSAAESQPPTGSQAVADRYIVAVSGMT